MTRRLSYRISADEAQMRTSIGTRKADSICIDGGQNGTALYGQYIPLPPGTYSARLAFKRDTPVVGTAILDVCAECGNRLLGQKSIDSAGIVEHGVAVIDFCCFETFTDIEVRLRSEGGFTGTIEGLEIFGELADPSPRVESTDLPAVPVERIMSRGRSPYDGYQRGVGLQFSDLPKKIIGDPDFKEARELAGRRTILGELVLCNLFLLVKFYLPHLPAGQIVEFGSYMGGGAIFLASLAGKFLPESKVYGFDTFAGMPPTDRRVDHHQAGSFGGVDLAELCDYVEEIGLRNLEFVQGDFADTALATLKRIEPVSLCHIDCDIRSAIECAYNSTKPYMVSGGYWIFDDPMVSDCLGAAEAMEDLLIRGDGMNSEQVFPHYVFRQR